ncbi:hypothetical protein [Gracilimonas tropica]|uniref:hypothetical protein n=1 Tax=Gracilimonas tropica TaxID=454600 RepID=UPI00037917FA|nr:hypothetical protein [Gracilimonas tropica]
MSYAVRNTIILLVTLSLFVGAAYSYIRFFQVPELEELQDSLEELRQDYNSKRATSDAFPQLNETYQNALNIIENSDKSLFKDPDPDLVFDYLNKVSNSTADSKVYFNFVFADSTTQDQYGILIAEITGYAAYRNAVNFINKIENSQLLNKVKELSLTPPNRNASEYDEINFSFTLESYYERIPIQENVEQTGKLTLNESISTYNPFYPLIQQTIPPNDDNMVNIERSRLIGLTGSRIFIVDQNGDVTTLREGDKVYLGELSSIDLNNETATFNLNKGGIMELVTLEIEQ